MYLPIIRQQVSPSLTLLCVTTNQNNHKRSIEKYISGLLITSSSKLIKTEIIKQYLQRISVFKLNHTGKTGGQSVYFFPRALVPAPFCSVPEIHGK